jgi:hypothetical protein
MEEDSTASLLRLAEQRFERLSDGEKRLLESALAGSEVVLGCGSADLNSPENDPMDARDWGEDRTIRAAVLQWLCLERTAREQVSSFGLHIIAARIDGRFDLSFAAIPFPLFFSACWWPEGLALRNASVPELTLTKCRIGPHSTFSVGGSAADAAILASGVQIRGSLLLDRGFRAEGPVNLLGAEVGGRLDCDGGSFRSTEIDTGAESFALNISEAKIRGAVLLRNDFQAEGQVRLYNTEIGDNLACDGSSFRNAKGTALSAEGAKIGRNVHLRNQFKAEGAVRLFQTEIGGSLDCGGGIINNAKGIALSAEGAKIGRNVHLRNRFQAEGEVRLFQSEIGGNLDCGGGSIHNVKGMPLGVEGAKIRGSVLLRNNFLAEGLVLLRNTQIGGHAGV